MPLGKASSHVQKAKDAQLFRTFKEMEPIFKITYAVLENKIFMKKTRLLTSMAILHFSDLIRFYNLFKLIMSELLSRFMKFEVPDMELTLAIYQKMLRLTKVVKCESLAVP